MRLRARRRGRDGRNAVRDRPEAGQARLHAQVNVAQLHPLLERETGVVQGHGEDQVQLQAGFNGDVVVLVVLSCRAGQIGEGVAQDPVNGVGHYPVARVEQRQGQDQLPA